MSLRNRPGTVIKRAASWAGNSPNVIHRNDKALVKESDSKEF